MLGIDVSAAQGRFDWKRLSQEMPEIKFAYVKAGERFSEDPQMRRNLDEASAYGLTTGVYWVVHPSQDPEHQADVFMQTAPYSGMPPVMDFELRRGNQTDSPVPVSVIVDCGARFVERTRQNWQRKPAVYTFKDYYEHTLGNPVVPAFQDSLLWMAHYGVPQPWIPASWNDYTFWQTHTGRTTWGQPIDFNTFRGTDLLTI